MMNRHYVALITINKLVKIYERSPGKLYPLKHGSVTTDEILDVKIDQQTLTISSEMSGEEEMLIIYPMKTRSKKKIIHLSIFVHMCVLARV